MADWISVDRMRLNAERSENIGGVTVRVMLSPYDIPTAARGSHDPHTGDFVIEFAYLDNEPWKIHPAGGTTLRIGKRSGRLYGIIIPDDLLKNEQSVNLELVLPQMVQSLVNTARDDLIHRHQLINPANFGAAMQAISGMGNKLAAAFG